MNRVHLGDAFDAVKCLWRTCLADVAPLYAEPRYIPIELQADYTRLTGIAMLGQQAAVPYSILNDPDTGVRLPGMENQREGLTHININSIAMQVLSRRPRPFCVITYDQSLHRRIEMNRDQQMALKMEELERAGVRTFYYVAQVSFLFALSSARSAMRLYNHLLDAGVPDRWFHKRW